MGDIFGWLLQQAPSTEPRTVNPGALAIDVRALITHAGVQLSPEDDTVNLLAVRTSAAVGQAIVNANGGMPEESTGLKLQQMAEQASENARQAVERVVEAVVDAVPAHVLEKLDGNPELLKEAAKLLVSKTIEIAKQPVGSALDRMQEEVATAVGAVEAEILSLGSEVQRFERKGEERASFHEVQLEAMEEAKGGATGSRGGSRTCRRFILIARRRPGRIRRLRSRSSHTFTFVAASFVAGGGGSNHLCLFATIYDRIDLFIRRQLTLVLKDLVCAKA